MCLLSAVLHKLRDGGLTSGVRQSSSNQTFA